MAQLPGDTEALATEQGLLRYHRAFSSFKDLLHVAFAYSLLDMSLRTLAPWAAEQKICKPISDVGMMKQLHRMGPCLTKLLAQTLQKRIGPASLPPGIVLVDSTSFARVGSKKVDWRVHLLWHASSGLSLDIKVVPATVGEPTCPSLIRSGDLLVADRHYCRQRTFATLHKEGTAFLIRASRNVPLLDETGKRVALKSFFPTRTMRAGTLRAFQVWLKEGETTFPARLIVIRNTEEAFQRARKKMLRKKTSKGVKQPDSPDALEAAHYTCLLTTIPAKQATDAQVATLYRTRWQIELCFKRWKSLLDLTHLRAQKPGLAETYILTKLLAAVLMEEALRQASFSPWGSDSVVCDREKTKCVRQAF